jgi:hypothetical protein
MKAWDRRPKYGSYTSYTAYILPALPWPGSL